MDAEVHKIRNGFIGIVVFFTGLLLFSGCSQETASENFKIDVALIVQGRFSDAR